MKPRRLVLVVDDEPLNRELVASCLHAVCDVEEAGDGVAAVERVALGGVDLVLLDVMMPRMNGLDACRTIKARSDGPFLPVLLLTALSNQEDRNAGLLAGADDFLQKPIDRRELTLRVKAMLRLREQDERIRDQVGELRSKKALIHAQLEELQQLQELKDDLFHLIIHDLRNPLTGVLGFVDLLREALVEPEQARLRRNADRAFEAAGKLQVLLEDVLEVRRLEAGAMPLKRTPVQPVDLVRDAARTLEGAAAARSIQVDVVSELSQDLLCDLDPTLTRRALENLLANALRFSPRQERVTMTARRAGPSLVLEVADNGPGLSDSGKLRLFKRFATEDANEAGGDAHDRPRRGFGLGLHLVKLVATAHGGEAIVRDRAGGGSVFGLSLPLGAGVATG